MYNFFILIESYGITAVTESEFREKSKRISEREAKRWQMLSAGSRGQAMGMGWQIRNSPLWKSSAPQ